MELTSIIAVAIVAVVVVFGYYVYRKRAKLNKGTLNEFVDKAAKSAQDRAKK